MARWIMIERLLAQFSLTKEQIDFEECIARDDGNQQAPAARMRGRNLVPVTGIRGTTYD